MFFNAIVDILIGSVIYYGINEYIRSVNKMPVLISKIPSKEEREIKFFGYSSNFTAIFFQIKSMILGLIMLVWNNGVKYGQENTEFTNIILFVIKKTC